MIVLENAAGFTTIDFPDATSRSCLLRHWMNVDGERRRILVSFTNG